MYFYLFFLIYYCIKFENYLFLLSNLFWDYEKGNILDENIPNDNKIESLCSFLFYSKIVSKIRKLTK